jgi:hypothetical protein
VASNRSENWDAQNLAQRTTVSFFENQYGDDPLFIAASNDRQNQELVYFNIADPDNDINAGICAGLLVDYVEAQGIPYHSGKTRGPCQSELSVHLKIGQGKVLLTADIVDDYFKFINEGD